MYAKNVAKMDILISDELNQMYACDYTGIRVLRSITTKRDEITSWNYRRYVCTVT
jgi:hypothetical protein